MNTQDGWLPRKEIWDGNRFSELSWFWNPEKEWLLPVKCPQCSSVITVAEISTQLAIESHMNNQVKAIYKNSFIPIVLYPAVLLCLKFCLQEENVQGEISCTECHIVFYHTPQYARGDPRNVALIGHWDGFRPFRSTGRHSCGEKHL